MAEQFPDLGEWQPTRRSLHAWCRVLSALRGALSEAHPRWWHISLAVTPRGLSTGPLGGDGPDRPAAELDLRRHRLTLRAGGRAVDSLTLRDAPSADRLADWLLDRLGSSHRLAVDLGDGKWRDDSARQYQPSAAERYHQAVSAAAFELEAMRGGLTGERGPVQLWAHHFDLAFELFGSRSVEWRGDREPAQIGFGFFPGDDADPRPYFYATPWPFDDALLERPLPSPARWLQEPWKGARLPYAAAVANPALVGEFLRVAHASGRSVLDS